MQQIQIPKIETATVLGRSGIIFLDFTLKLVRIYFQILSQDNNYIVLSIIIQVINGLVTLRNIL